jgi:hypothetical protein
MSCPQRECVVPKTATKLHDVISEKHGPLRSSGLLTDVSVILTFYVLNTEAAASFESPGKTTHEITQCVHVRACQCKYQTADDPRL